MLYKRIYWLGVLIVVVLIAATFLFGLDELLANRGYSQRFIIWGEVWRQLLNDCSFIFGCDIPKGYLILGEYWHPHNVYLAMFYHNGLLGGGLFCVFAILFFYNGIKSKSVWMIISLFGWGALITENNSLFTSPQSFWIYFWLPVFMSILESNKAKIQKYWEVLFNKSSCYIS